MLKSIYKFFKKKNGKEKKNNTEAHVDNKNNSKRDDDFQNTAPENNLDNLSFNGHSQFVFENPSDIEKKLKEENSQDHNIKIDEQSNSNLSERKKSDKEALTPRGSKENIKSMIPYFEKNTNLKDKYEYLNELNATLSITLEIIESEVKELKITNEAHFDSQKTENPEGDKSNEFESILEIIKRIGSSLEKNYHLRKEKFSCNSKVLLANLVREEKVRERRELIEENERQIRFLENIIEDKKMLMIQAEDAFGEFEKHFTMIRVMYPEYSLFDIKIFIEENCKLVRQKDKKYIRTYLIKDAIQNKTDEVKEYKIFLRSLDLWKGIQIENADGNNFTTNTKAISLLQEGCHNLLNSISNVEMNVLNLSVIFVGWLTLVSEYQFDKKKEFRQVKSVKKFEKIIDNSDINQEIINHNNNKDNNEDNNDKDKETILSSEANSNKFQINSVKSELIDCSPHLNQERKIDNNNFEKRSLESASEAIRNHGNKNSPKDVQSGYCESIKLDEASDKKLDEKYYEENKEKKFDEVNSSPDIESPITINNIENKNEGIECDEILTTNEIEKIVNQRQNAHDDNKEDKNENDEFFEIVETDHKHVDVDEIVEKTTNIVEEEDQLNNNNADIDVDEVIESPNQNDVELDKIINNNPNDVDVDEVIEISHKDAEVDEIVEKQAQEIDVDEVIENEEKLIDDTNNIEKSSRSQIENHNQINEKESASEADYNKFNDADNLAESDNKDVVPIEVDEIIESNSNDLKNNVDEIIKNNTNDHIDLNLNLDVDVDEVVDKVGELNPEETKQVVPEDTNIQANKNTELHVDEVINSGQKEKKELDVDVDEIISTSPKNYELIEAQTLNKEQIALDEVVSSNTNDTNLDEIEKYNNTKEVEDNKNNKNSEVLTEANKQDAANENENDKSIIDDNKKTENNEIKKDINAEIKIDNVHDNLKDNHESQLQNNDYEN